MATSSDMLRRFREANGDEMSVDNLVTELGYSGQPVIKSRSLTRNGNSLQTTVLESAWQAAGVDLDDPEDIDQIWLPGADIVILDLQTEGSE